MAGVRESSVGEDGLRGTRMVGERLLEGAGLELAPRGFRSRGTESGGDTVSRAVPTSPSSQRESGFQTEIDPDAG